MQLPLTSSEREPVFTFVIVLEAGMLSEDQPFLKVHLPHGFGLPAINYTQQKLLYVASKCTNTRDVD